MQVFVQGIEKDGIQQFSRDLGGWRIADDGGLISLRTTPSVPCGDGENPTGAEVKGG